MLGVNVRCYFSTLFGVFLATLICASANAQQGSIRVGEINSYTGPLAAFTVPYRNGWQLAIEDSKDLPLSCGLFERRAPLEEPRLGFAQRLSCHVHQALLRKLHLLLGR